MDVRLEKARAIVSTAKLRRKGGAWLVPSQTGAGKGYIVTWAESDPEGWRYPDGGKPGYRCTCADFEHRRKDCKHILAVCIVITREAERTETTAPDGSKTVTERTVTKVEKRTTYRQVWPAYNAAQTGEKATFQTLLADLVAGVAEPEQHMGRKRIPLRDQLFGAIFKTYSTLSGRRFMTDLRAAQVAGHISHAPHYNSLFRCFENPDVTPILLELVSLSAAPLASVETDFAVDSTGFTTSKFTRWFDHKWGEVKQEHDWKKLHAMVGTKTQIVTSVAVSRGHANDSPFFATLVAKTAERFTMTEVSADKAYSSKANLAAVVDRGATPYIPFRANASSLGIARVSPLWRRMFHYYNMEREAFLGQYHKRSNVESAFSMMKRKFGDALRSKTEVAQFNEALCKVLAHNICCLIQSIHELGIAPTFWTEPQAA